MAYTTWTLCRKPTPIVLTVSVAINLYLVLYGFQMNINRPTESPNAVTEKQCTVAQDDKSQNFVAVSVPSRPEDNVPKPIIPGQSVCEHTSKWMDNLIKPNIPSDMKDWSFKGKNKCPNFSIEEFPKSRDKISLHCDGKKSKISTSPAYSLRDITEVDFGSKCLLDVIENCCVGAGKVPNVIHYVWYADRELDFFHFVSFMSAWRFVKPCLILIHGKFLPRGKYWDFFISVSPNVIHVKRERPSEIYGNKLVYPEHGSDVMRIEALIEYGGIYLDFDQIVLRPLEPLQKYEYTMSHETDTGLAASLLMAKKNATFLNIWHQSYRSDYNKQWAYNSVLVPYQLSQKYPELIHVEGYNFTRPNWLNVNLIFKENFDFSTNYGMHLYVRWYKNHTDVDVIRTLNTTIGAVSRHVLFGNKELCEN